MFKRKIRLKKKTVNKNAFSFSLSNCPFRAVSSICRQRAKTIKNKSNKVSLIHISPFCALFTFYPICKFKRPPKIKIISIWKMQ